MKGAGASRREALLLAALAVLAPGACRRAATEAAPSSEVETRAERHAASTADRFEVERVPPGGVELVSDYSRIVISDVGPMRAMYFANDDGTLVMQTRVDLSQPDRLLLGYQRALFASYLFTPRPSRVLVVGLGGGGMVRFLASRDPAVRVDAIDIDPVVVDAAQRYFGTRPSDTVRLLTADGYDFIRQAEDRYDVIYMDVFLRPSDETDQAGAALRIKDLPFYAAMSERLTPQGVVAFNLFPHPRRQADVAELRQAFAQVYLFGAEGEDNWIAIASREAERLEPTELRARAAALDERFAGGLSFSRMVDLYRG